MPKYLKIIFSVMLAAYLVVALTMTARENDDDICKEMSITVEDADGDTGVSRFVTPAELARELDDLPSKAKGIALANINTQDIRHRLLDLDKIEDAEVVRYSDGSIRIHVTPIVPVLRVFDGPSSYYVNRAGKRVKASARYHKNVPMIQGHFEPSDSVFTPMSLMPLVNFIASDSLWNSYISMIKVKSPTDILLIPNIREHVINIGSIDRLREKMDNLQLFYSKVLVKQGWEKYDTISLKWNGQIVATKRHRRAPDVPVISREDDEIVAIDAMLAGDNVAPGQTIPGQAAHSEQPIPAKNDRTTATN
ncbi:MAG: hypothetical protein K2K77_04675 [Duncaniella sp.]|nr:hypothetical protein [Duncaniella sp.]